MITVHIKRLNPFATIPTYATDGSACLDVYACPDNKDEVITIDHGCRALIPTGLAVALPPGYEMEIRPRSGLALKYGVTVLNSPGTLDEDYTGPLNVILFNTSNERFTVRYKDRIAQLAVREAPKVALEEVAELPPTVRGDRGFGSSGR